MKKSQQISFFHLLCQESSSTVNLNINHIDFIVEKEQWEYVHRKIIKTFFTIQKYYEIATGKAMLNQMGPKDTPSILYTSFTIEFFLG